MTKLSLDRFLPYRLSIASNRVSDLIARGYRGRFGLRIAEWRLVAVLAEDGALSQQALTSRTRMDKVTVSRAAIALVERGLIERQPNPHDLRSHLLGLSGEGARLYEDIAPMALATEAGLFANFSDEEVSLLREMLQRLEDAVDTITQERG